MPRRRGRYHGEGAAGDDDRAHLLVPGFVKRAPEGVANAEHLLL
jgi:hypothetical protein